MAKKRFYQSSDNQAEHDNIEQQEQGGTSVNLQTVLLGVIALALVIQVFLMLGNRGGSSTPAYIPSAGGGTANVGTQQPVRTQPSQPAAQMTPSQPATGQQQQQPAGANPITINPAQQATPQTAPSGNNTSVNYSKTTHDFGTLSRANGPQPEHTFTVTNTGKQPLTYTNVSVDAGGTVLAYPVNPIPPGGKGEIKVRINPANTSGAGQQMLRIHMDANTDPGHQHIDLSMNITD